MSFTNLEQRLTFEMRDPIKKFGGLNHIRMCGRKARCFLGEKPKALLFTFMMVNIPATFFNSAIAPVPLWGESKYYILAVGLFLQLTANFLMFYTSMIDPGIVPATFVSKEAFDKLDKKYTHIKHKS